MFEYFISIATIAGFTIIWRNWLEDHESWKNFIQNNLSFIGKAFLCGSCFTYWMSLLYVLCIKPIANIFSVSFSTYIFFSWMAISYGSVLLRFFYVMIQEVVHYQMHHIRDTHKH